MQDSSNRNVFRVYNTLKKFEDNFRTEISFSFAMAAEEIEYNQMAMNNQAFNQSTKKLPLSGDSIKLSEVRPADNQGPPLPGPGTSFRPSRQSIKLMQMFQEKKFQNIR